MKIFKGKSRKRLLPVISFALSTLAAAPLARADSQTGIGEKKASLLLDMNISSAKSDCVINSGIPHGALERQYWPILSIDALVAQSDSIDFPQKSMVHFEMPPYSFLFSNREEAEDACDKLMRRFSLISFRMFHHFVIDLKLIDTDGLQQWIGKIKDRTNVDDQGDSLPLPDMLTSPFKTVP